MSEASPTRPVADAMPGRRACIAVILGTVVLAFALQIYFGMNQDTSWMIEVAGRLLDGQVLYKDILENNPPAAFLIEALAVLLARAVGVSAEAVTVVLMVLAAGSATALAGGILRRAGLLDKRSTLVLAAAAAVTLLIMPMQSFAQREHIAVLASLPALAVLCARSERRSPSLAAAILAGLGASVAICIKPFFVLAFVGPLCFAFAAAPRRVLAAVELWILAAVVLAYAAFIVALFPTYVTETVPLAELVYLPARLGLVDLLTLPMTLLWAFMMLVFWRGRGWADPVARVLALASAGFEASVFVQGKGFAYHGYPALALGGMACAAAIARYPEAGRGRAPSPSALPVVAALLASFVIFVDEPSTDSQAPGLAEAIRTIAPRPRLLTIGSDMRFGRAFAHQLGGTWTGSGPAAWVTAFATVIRADAEDVPPYAERIAAERDSYAADVTRSRPDIILIEGDNWKRWSLRGPSLSAALSGYRDVGRFGRFILLKRPPAAAGAQAAAP